VPIVQKWIDKWFWRGYRLLSIRSDDDGLHAFPKKIMSWKEAWGNVFRGGWRRFVQDLSATASGSRNITRWRSRRKITTASGVERPSISIVMRRLSTLWLPTEAESAWFAEKYPESFNRSTSRAMTMGQGRPKESAFYNNGCPGGQLCRVCHDPHHSSRAGDPQRS